MKSPLRRLGLRNRLLLPLGLLLVALIGVGGNFVVVRTSKELTAQLDRRLGGALDRLVQEGGLPGGGPDAQPGSGPLNPPSTPRQKFAPGPATASLILDVSGSLVGSRPTGYVSAPDPLPTVNSANVKTLLRKPSTVDAVDGSFRYRALAVRGGDLYFVEAASLRDADAAIANLSRTLFLGGAVALLIAMAAAWFILGRGLRPVEQMVTTATRIASGDLDARVGTIDEHTELGRLGTALNVMLEQVTGALRVREQSERRLEQFVADASHELQTPVTAIRGYAELYRFGGLHDPVKLRGAMETVERESTRMGDLVDALLSITTIETSQTSNRRATDIGELAAEAVEVARAIEPARLLSLESTPGTFALIDPQRIRQVLDNLLKNVRAHTSVDAPALVTVRPDTTDGSVVVTVQDGGPGLSSEALAHVFDRFWRGDVGRDRRSGGSGLGLAIAHAIVEAHGGTIAASNGPPTDTSRPGLGGAVFEMRLPGVVQQTFSNPSS